MRITVSLRTERVMENPPNLSSSSLQIRSEIFCFSWQRVRVVKESDSKSDRLRLRRFESYRCRFCWKFFYSSNTFFSANEDINSGHFWKFREENLLWATLWGQKLTSVTTHCRGVLRNKRLSATPR